MMPDYTVRVSRTLDIQIEDTLLMEALLRFDGHPIRSPEKLNPLPRFLLSHAKKFGLQTSAWKRLITAVLH